MKSLYFGASLAPRMEQAASQIQDSSDLSVPLELAIVASWLVLGSRGPIVPRARVVGDI